MERKRKLPPRAAARGENASKKRNITPRERSDTPAIPLPTEVEEHTPTPPPAPTLPTSVQPGHPLPTVEEPQGDNLSGKEYQSLNESGVLVESLSRSRNRWINDGLFEKYYTKPYKRKGVVVEDPKNPPKESMSRVGTVTIAIEPHVIEATMWIVKESKQRPAQTQQPSQTSQIRPIIQYGPPNGSMPPPPSPSPAPSTPTPAVVTKPPTPNPPKAASQQPIPKPALETKSTNSPKPEAPSAVISGRATTSASPAPPPLVKASMGGVTQPPQSSVPPPQAATTVIPQPAHTAPHPGSAGPAIPSATTGPPLAARPPMASAKPATNITSSSARPLAPPAVGAPQPKPIAPVPGPSTPVAAPAPAPAAAKPAANDPVIALLARKASSDPQLREMMGRVAHGEAKEGELAQFQSIIDQLNAEYKSKGGQQGPSADRLSVDGRTVKYFADEVRTILDIVLTSNPNQRPAELRPPAGSDFLVVQLVKAALENQRTKDMIRRIAENRPGFTDATDLKDILEKLHKEMKRPPPPVAAPQPAKAVGHNGLPNGHAKIPAPPPTNPGQQALRSKGPPPAPKPDVAAVLFDFGSGDRYLFPKFSMLEYLQTPTGQQVLASFLLVRKGSLSEYGGDPKLDYYQPVTIRISASSGRHLENLARAVAPQEEVRRYMDDVMDNMTRGEYVLLAMRLPRELKEEDNDSSGDEPKTSRSTPQAAPQPEAKAPVNKPSVLWTAKAGNNNAAPTKPTKLKDVEDEADGKYRKLIRSVMATDAEAS